MARDTSIALSVKEREQLRDVREDMFDTDEVPYGVVIQKLVDNYRE